MSKVLILGGTGFIGLELAKHLHRESDRHDIWLVDNFSRGRCDAEVEGFLKKSAGCHLHCADLTVAKSFEVLNETYDEVYLLAAVVGVRYTKENPAEVLRTNVQITMNVLDWAHKATVGRLLFASSSEVYSGAVELGIARVPTSESTPLVITDIKEARFSYAVSKTVGEAMALAYDTAYAVPCVVVRFHNVYGPRMGYEHVIPELTLRALRHEMPFRVYGADQTRAFCFVDDAVRGTVMAMRSGVRRGIYHIGNDNEEVTIADLAKRIQSLTGHHADVAALPASAGSVSRRCPDIGKMRALGYEPRVSLDEGLGATVDWYRRHQTMNG
ncbi:MAG: NAD-dependent epimerase/dehydratase family protein [Nitrospira sp.]|nr:NAD-dependent epimerase/dehydratase family protein [Nitrospira sp.]